MDNKEDKELHNLAKHTLTYCNLLIKQCESWLDPPFIKGLKKNSCNIMRNKKDTDETKGIPNKQ